jgi:hypothetical protein
MARSALTSKALIILLAAVLLTSACSSAAVAEPVSYKVSDPMSDTIFDYSEGDNEKVESPSNTVDIVAAELLVSVDSMTATITLAELPQYVSPSTFETDAIVDRIYTYYFYFETTGDGSFDYRLSATNDYDTGAWAGELWTNTDQQWHAGGSEFPGLVYVSGSTIYIDVSTPFDLIPGDSWAVCPGAEFAYSKVANSFPPGSNIADYIWHGTTEDTVVGVEGAPTCLLGQPAPIIVLKSEVIGGN